MPKKSTKTDLIDTLAINAVIAIDYIESDDDAEIERVFDNFENDIFEVLSRRYATSRIIKTPKSKDWFYNVLPNYGEREFKENLRVSRVDFGRILNIISTSSEFNHVGEGKQFPIAVQLALTLFRFGVNGTGSSHSKLAQKFGIGNGTVDAITKRVIRVI